MTVLAGALFTGTAAGLIYRDIQTNIDRHDISDYLAGDRPTADGETQPPLDPAAGRAVNILVMGSDSRADTADGSTGTSDMRSDTTMLVHLSADRSRVEIVSIPRDTLVEIPSCVLPDGTSTAYQYEAMFNSAFSIGGQGGNLGAAAACTIRTVENLTGVLVDDFVVVDFNGFIDMVDAIGGVPMCIPEPISDSRADLELEAGQQVLNGEEALGFARVRYTLTGGSDIGRISRQQELVGAIAREVLSRDILSNMPQLYQFLEAATSSLTTGQDIGDLRTVAGFGYALRNIQAENITFATMPFDWAGARVRPAWNAPELWAALQNDEPIQAALDANGETPDEDDETSGTAAQDGTSEETVSPDETSWTDQVEEVDESAMESSTSGVTDAGQQESDISNAICG